MTALAPESSSVTAYLNPVIPSIAAISMRSRHVSGWEASQVLKGVFNCLCIRLLFERIDA